MASARRRATLLLATALLLGMLAAFTFLQYARSVDRSAELVNVLVAAQQLSPGQAITADAIKRRPIPRGYLTENLLTDFKQAEKKVVLLSVQPGDLITSNMLHAPDSQNADNRVITLTSGSSVVIEPDVAVGDRADMIASYKDATSERTELFLCDLTVVARHPTDRAISVSLLVSLNYIEDLVKAENFAKQLRIIRRPLQSQGANSGGSRC